MINIFAYTPPGSYPPYISINEHTNGLIYVTLRGGAGTSAEMILPKSELKKLGERCFSYESHEDND